MADFPLNTRVLVGPEARQVAHILHCKNVVTIRQILDDNTVRVFVASVPGLEYQVDLMKKLDFDVRIEYDDLSKYTNVGQMLWHDSDIGGTDGNGGVLGNEPAHTSVPAPQCDPIFAIRLNSAPTDDPEGATSGSPDDSSTDGSR